MKKLLKILKNTYKITAYNTTPWTQQTRLDYILNNEIYKSEQY